ncbi:MAG TPA: hypothetical protein VGD67_05965, partial [Pseudonocardiaceae bacterium]
GAEGAGAAGAAGTAVAGGTAPRGVLVGGYAVAVAAAATWLAARGGVTAPIGGGHVAFTLVVGLPLLGALGLVTARRLGPRRGVAGALTVATLFFALGVGLLLLPFGLLPTGVALASLGFDIALLGVAVAVSDALDEGETLPRDMLRSLLAAGAVSVLFGGQVGLVLATAGTSAALVTVLFGSVAASVAVQVLAGPFAGLLDRLAFAGSPALRDDRARLRDAAEVLPRRADTAPDAVSTLDDEEFARLTRRALSHYGNLGRLVASPLTGLAVIDERLAARGAPDQPLERAAELKALLTESITRLKPRDAGDFGTSDEWRHYNALYFPYVVGMRPYAQLASPAGLDPVARQAWQWFTTTVPQRSLHNWQNAAARLVAADLRAQQLR